MKFKIFVLFLICFSNNIFAQDSTVTNSFFVENKGQWPSEVLFKTSMSGMDVWVTTDGTVFNSMDVEEIDSSIQIVHGHAVNFKRINPSNPTLQLTDKLGGVYNYYLGDNPANWATNVGRFSVGQVNNVFNAVDLRYYFNANQLEYDYIVHPNANPNDIQFEILGSDGYSINSLGDLEVQTQLGVVTHKGLKLYQIIDGQEVAVTGSYVYTANGIGIAVGNYDTSRDLIIDPIVWYTFVGGIGIDEPKDVGVGWVGSKVFTTGYTQSANFPTIMGSYDKDLSGLKDAFVTMYSEFIHFEYSTFFGGENSDEAHALSLDIKNNQVHIVGETTSNNDAGFPLLHAFDDTFSGQVDVFVASFYANGGTLAYSSYYGGDADDIGYDIVEGKDGFYITGKTSSSNLELVNPYQNEKEGGSDVFVAKFKQNNNLELVYSTYLGGSADDEANGIDLDGAGRIYVTGYTRSNDFPKTAVTMDFYYRSGKDVFVTCLENDGSDIVYSGCLGGNNNDVANDIVVDYESSAYITGYTLKSSTSNYPTTTGAYNEQITDAKDAFVTKISFNGQNNLANLSYSTFVGGEGWDSGEDITLCGNNVYLTGYTNASDFFGSTGVTLAGRDAYYASLDEDGENLTGEFIGGTGDQIGYGISFGQNGLFVVGSTTSHFDIDGLTPIDEYSNDKDGFIAAINTNCEPSCNTVIVSTDQSWPSDLLPGQQGPYQVVRVQSGATLTIEPGYEVLFCPNGTLDIAAYSTLKLHGVLSSYATQWDGVRMEGVLGNVSNFRGYPGSKISNAFEAISNYQGWDGGVPSIDCSGTSFENNRVSIRVIDASSAKISFRKCDFVVNSNFTVGVPDATQVVIRSIDRAYFEGCTFDNQIDCLNGGIISGNCILYVRDHCEGLQSYPCPAPYLIHSSFNSMKWGVFVFGNGLSSVSNAEFNNCQYGILNLGQSASSFYGNTFHLGNMPSIFFEPISVKKPFQVGISYYDGINGMSCVNNKFIGEPTSFTHTIGIHVYAIGGFENLIKGNNFERLTRANVAEKNNASVLMQTGLNYTCNKNKYNAVFDFHAMDMSSVRSVIEDEESPHKSARNTFSKFSTNPFRDFNNEGAWITYYYRNVGNEIPTDVQNVNSMPAISSHKVCPNDLKGPCKYCLTAEEKKENLKTYFVEAFLTAQAKSNYEAMKQSGNTARAKSYQEEWQYHRHLMDVAADLGYGAALIDTVHYNRDTVRLWMRRFDNITGDYLLIDDYLATREIGMAQSVLSAIPQRYALTSEEWMDYQNVAVIYDYLFENADVALPNDVKKELRTFAESKKGHACALARKVLAVHGIIYPPIITMPTGYSPLDEEVPKTKLAVSPNPTDYYVRFDWKDFVVDGDVVIEITDQLGGLIEVLHPIGVKSIEWTTEKVSGALCNYRLLIGGVERDRGVIVINK